MAESYKVISRRWLNAFVGLLTTLLLLVGYLSYLSYNLQQKVRAVETDADVISERRKAFDEMQNNRMEIIRFSYNRACQYAKERGETCIANPRFYADPLKYPTLSGKDGLGLLPPTQEEK